MQRKRRFGISLPEELADAVDRLAKALSTTRSAVVTDALRTYVEMRRHLIEPHECTGVMVLVDDEESPMPIRVVHEFGDVIRSHLHVHVEGRCINILVVKGPSERIAELESRIRSLMPHCRIYYLPLAIGHEEHGH